ncbi:MAG: hypothetical protein AAFQ89_17270 [Cyanobacteria bacterium J06626_18]
MADQPAAGNLEFSPDERVDDRTLRLSCQIFARRQATYLRRVGNGD